ncbi:hypothetical protein GCM10023156_10850 [Novipirellula rosea]|uniref:Uncharacterized protein n=1 Tax=Novipirellula rosea TaxID=1031540 RepID=A0ABP8MBU9_9BACT
MFRPPAYAIATKTAVCEVDGEVAETIPTESHRRRNVLAVEPHPNQNDVAETLAFDRDTNQFQLSTESSSSIITNHCCVSCPLKFRARNVLKRATL